MDAFWTRKVSARAKEGPSDDRVNYEPIEMPKNSATGFVTAFFAVVTGFALIWHIWWMAGLGVFGAFVTILVFAFREHEEVEIPARQIAEIDRAHPAGVVA